MTSPPGRREAEAVDADRRRRRARRSCAHVDVTVASMATRLRQDLRQHLVAVRGRLAIEAREARHADDARPGPERLGGLERVLQLAARRQEDEVERRGLLLRDVAALAARLRAASSPGSRSSKRDGLPREREQRRAVGALERGDEGARRLLGIGRADDVEVRDDAEARDGLDGLVGRAVLADADAVVREDVDDRQVAERGEADRRRGSSRRRRGTSRRSGGRCRAPRCRSGSRTCRARGCRSGCCGPVRCPALKSSLPAFRSPM